MTHHRPSDELLLDYAAGTAPEPLALFIATHLALSPESRAEVRQLEAVGGALLDSLDPAAPAPDALARVFARIEAGETIAASPPGTRISALLPAPLATYVPDDLDALPWRKVIGGVFEAELPCSTRRYKASLLRIEAGRNIPRHTHRGGELTLVLDGAFRDALGRYARGDVSIADDSVDHQPVAENDKTCLCLVVAEGPVRLTGFFSRLLNPFLRH